MRLTEKENGMFLTKQPFTEMINKLGQLEDIMEKYGINSAEELEHIILNDATGEEAFREYVETNVMPYRNIEEELGIGLVALIKALKNGIWIQEVHDKKKTIHVEVTLYHLEGFVIPYKKRYDKEGNYFGSVRYFSDYKRTWALTKDELEKNG